MLREHFCIEGRPFPNEVQRSSTAFYLEECAGEEVEDAGLHGLDGVVVGWIWKDGGPPGTSVAKLLDKLLGRVVVSTTPGLFRRAVVLQSRFMLSHWDAAICQAAIDTGCRLLFSEDMGSGGIYDRVMVLNPFEQDGRWIGEDPPGLDRLE